MNSEELATMGGILGKDIYDIVKANVKSIEKNTKLTPVYLDKQGFADTALSTGSLCLDAIMGGGIPAGRVIGIAGPEHSGKSLLATEIVSRYLQMGGIAAYFDAEGANDPIFLRARGINFEKYRGKRKTDGSLLPGEIDTLLYYQPETGEQVRDYMYNVMNKLPENRNAKYPPILFLLDSVVALITDAMSDDPNSNKMSMHAKMYAEMLPIIGPLLTRTGCTFLYTNQLRSKPGVSYGSPVYEPAGDALKFWASIRINLDRNKPKVDVGATPKDHPFVDGFIKKCEPKAGGVWQEPHFSTIEQDRYIYTAIKTVKNKIFTPFKHTWMRISFEYDGGTGYGLDPVYDVFTFLMEQGLFKKPTPRGKGAEKERVATLEGMYEFIPTFEWKELGFESDRFNYDIFKQVVLDNKAKIFTHLRDKYIKSNLIYEKKDSVEMTDTATEEEASKEEAENGN